MWFGRGNGLYNCGRCYCIDENAQEIRIYSVDKQCKFWVPREEIIPFSAVCGIADEGDLLVSRYFAATMGWCKSDEYQ